MKHLLTSDKLEMPRALHYCVERTAIHFAPIIESSFINRTYPPEMREFGRAIAESVRQEFKRELNVTDWLNEETRTNLMNKLDNLTYEVGFSEKVSHTYKYSLFGLANIFYSLQTF